MKRLLLGLILIFHLSAISQDQNNSKGFDSIFDRIAVNISSTNPTKALYLADSLYNYAINDRQRVRALLLSADILDKQEKRMEGIQYAMKSLVIAEKSKDYTFQARIYGYMSTQYRELGFLDKGKDYIQKGLDISYKIKDKDQLTEYQAMANHELADYAVEEKDYKKGIEYSELALLGYKQDKDEDEQYRNFVIGNVEELLGRCYMGLGDYDQALHHLLTSSNLIKGSEAKNTIWASAIYQGVGDAYLKLEELDSAEVYLKKALPIAEEGSNGSLKEWLYESMSSYYKQRKELDSAAIYAMKYRDIVKENRIKENRMVNIEFNRALSTSKQKANNTVFYIIASTILGLGIILTIYYFRRKRTPQTIIEDNSKESQGTNGLLISLRVQEEILQKLKEFELSEVFLDKNMSFPGLVSYLNTNAKYLNYILKKEENKDFNTYINDLRIEYIISKLKSDPEYLNYKISYLADISGFSSHSNFSANFKRVTEFSPSEFIESINNSA